MQDCLLKQFQITFNKDKDSLLHLSVTNSARVCLLSLIYELIPNIHTNLISQWRKESMTTDCSQPVTLYRQLRRNATCTLGGFLSRPRQTHLWGVQSPPVRASVCLRTGWKGIDCFSHLSRTHQKRIIMYNDWQWFNLHVIPNLLFGQNSHRMVLYKIADSKFESHLFSVAPSSILTGLYKTSFTSPLILPSIQP